MKFSAAALLLLAFISFNLTESVEDNGRNLRGQEINDEEDDERADLFEFRTTDLSNIFQLGTPTWGGSGCPAGTVQVVTSPEDIPGEKGVQAVTVLFDAYIADTGMSGRNRDYKSCNLAIPLKAKPGIQIGIFQVDYRGNTNVPKGSGYMSQFRAEYFFSGMRGPTVRRVFGRTGNGYGLSGPDWGDFAITNDVAAIVWSRCGAATNFRINTSITAQKPVNGRDDTSININTVDTTVKAAYTLRYFLTSRRCSN